MLQGMICLLQAHRTKTGALEPSVMNAGAQFNKLHVLATGSPKMEHSAASNPSLSLPVPQSPHLYQPRGEKSESSQLVFTKHPEKASGTLRG